MMRRLGLIVTLMLLCCSALAHTERDTLGVGTAVNFVANEGQWNERCLFAAQLHDGALFIERGCLTVSLRSHRGHPVPQKGPILYHAYRMRFAGSTDVAAEGLYRQEGYNNFYLGNNPARWRSGVPSFGAVRYSGLYEGVDLEVYGNGEMLKYNLIVQPGADASQPVIEYEGVEGMEITASGSLVVKTTVRDVVEVKPYVYQADTHGGKVEREIKSRWRMERIKGKRGFWKVWIDIGEYDHTRELVIDPVLIFSTYTGSTADNWGTTATYDSHKNVYTAGLVFDVGYPVSTGAYSADFNGGCDIGIFKFDSTGSQRLFATYLGGAYADMPHSLFVNSFDELLVFGTTGSQDFPVTPGAYQTSHAGGSSLSYEDAYDQRSIFFPQGSDIFVCRFKSDGTQLQASTLVGGSGNDGLHYRSRYNNSLQTIMGGNDSLYYNYGDGARGEIITDNLNNVYVGSTTFSSDFPVTAGSVQPLSGGGQDGVVFKLDHNLRNMLWSTYLGGSNDDAIYSIDVDSAFNLLVCGGTVSRDFPVTEGTFQTTYGGGTADGFVSKISYGGERLMASSFVGNRFYDQLYFVRVGRHNEVFLFGQSKNSGASMIHNANYGVVNGGMLLLRLSPDLTQRRWSTLFGTAGRINLSPSAFAADICNRVYAAGWGRDFAPHLVNWYTAGTTGMETTADAYSSTTDGQDFYIFCLSSDANQLEYASFFGEPHNTSGAYSGGDHVDGGTSRFDRLATLYQSVCASCTGTQNFPTTAAAWSDSNQSVNCNNALFRFNVNNDFPVAEFIPPTVGCAPYTVQFQNTGRGNSFSWDFGDGTVSTDRDPTHTYAAAGQYTVTLVAYLPAGCATSDTMRYTVHVIGSDTPPTLLGTACNGGSIQIGPVPQIGATYQWISGSVSDPSIANPWVSATGTYLLRVSTVGCSEVDTFNVQAYTLVDSILSTSPSCHDSADGRLRFRLGTDINPDSLTINVSPTHPVSPFTQSGGRTYFTLDSLVAGVTYTVDITGYGCSYSHQATIPNPQPPYYTKEYTPTLCNDSCNGWIFLHYALGDTADTPLRDTLFPALCPGTYTLHIDVGGCPLLDTSVIVRDHTLDSLRVWADRQKIYLGESVSLHADIIPQASGLSFQWSPAEDLDRPDIQHPVATPSDTLVIYRATVSDGSCTVSDTLHIHCTDVICGAPEFLIPNAFSPNGDGINDRLCFNADILSEFNIALFNRWGQCVYQSTDPADCWDGTFRNSPCPSGVYTYTCHIRCHNGTENNFKGDITLIR